ncbi:MAG: hypothetical protein ACLFV2_01100 [Desulfurivibrionaceae bacterium]
MWKHLIILGALLGLAKFNQLDLSPYYQTLVDSLAAKNLPILVYTISPALILVIATLFLRNSFILGIIRLIVNIILEISLFFVTLISFGSIYWTIYKDGNPWQELQRLLPIPAISLITVVICINIIDFNKPIIKRLIPYMVIAAASFLMVVYVLPPLVTN